MHVIRKRAVKAASEQHVFFFFESGDKIQPVSLLKNHIESAAAHYINTVQPIAGLATGGGGGVIT